MAKRNQKETDGVDVDATMETVDMVSMVRDEPLHPDGPTTALVHPDEVENWLRYDWRIDDDSTASEAETS